MNRFFAKLLALFLAVIAWVPQGAQAAVALKDRYQAAPFLTVSEVVMQPGETKELKFGFKNTGSITWKKTDKAYISLYTYGPKYRKSIFQEKSWFSSIQPVKYSGADVAPGSVAFINFKLKAPTAAGTYKETFWLAAEDLTWIPGAQFTVTIKVGAQTTNAAPTTPAATTTSTTPASTTVSQQTAPVIGTVAENGGAATPVHGLEELAALQPAAGLTGMVLIRSAQSVQTRGAQVINFRVGIKNQGTTPWPNISIKPSSLHVASATVTAAQLRTASWLDALTAAQVPQVIQPGQLAFLDFSFTAPARRGEYPVSFVAAVNGSPVDGTYIDIPVTVTDDASLPPPVYTTPQPPSTTLEAEPMLRVGINKTTEGDTLAASGPWQITDQSGTSLIMLPQTTTASLKYINGTYVVLTSDGRSATSFTPLRAMPQSEPVIFTVTTMENRPTWDPSINDNRFRGIMELRYSTANQTVWLINEIPMETYLKGLAEMGDRSPGEYHKALLVAARTYAYYHYTTKAKHKDRGFHIDDYYDQVYKGYGQELRQPNIVRAVEETRGMVVRYQGQLALTPYSARSDGRTRSHKEVWGTEIPYLQSVPTPYNVGKTMFGHGVGLDATDAAQKAQNDGWDWQRLVKYYFTGVDIEKRW